MKNEDNIIELMEHGPVPQTYLKMAYPIVAGMLVTIIYGIVDVYFVAMTGNKDMIAGVSLIAPIYTILVAVGDILGYGCGTVVSRLIGENNLLAVKKISRFSFTAAIGMGIVCMAALLCFKRPILFILGADSETFAYAQGYYIWIAVASIPVILYFVLSNTLRAVGHAKDVMIGVTVGTIINLALDPVFIFALKQGAAGAAMATAVGMTFQAGYYVYVCFIKCEQLRFSREHRHLEVGYVKEIFKIGIPASMTNATQAFMLAITNVYLIQYSRTSVAAMGIAQKVVMISFLLLTGIAVGGQPMIGYAFGTRNSIRLKEIIRFMYKICIVSGLIGLLFVEIFADPIMRCFSSDPEILKMGALMLRVQYAGSLFQALIIATSCLGLSIGEAVTPLILSVSRQGFVYAAVIVIMNMVLGFTGVIWAQCAADVLTAIIAVILYKYIILKRLGDL